MAMPELVRKMAEREIERFCDHRIPARLRDKVRLEHHVRGDAITIFECRPPWRPDFGPEWTRMKIAQLRFDPGTREWTLYWADRNGRWLLYRDLESSPDIRVLLTEVDEDRYACFWG